MPHVPSAITLPGDAVLLQRTHPCPADAASTQGAGFIPAAMGRSVLETTTPVAVSKCLALSTPGAACPLGKADEGVIQKSQDGLSALKVKGNKSGK